MCEMYNVVNMQCTSIVQSTKYNINNYVDLQTNNVIPSIL